MNRIFRWAIVTGLWLAAIATPAMAGNVLLNPGFEADPTGQTSSILGWNPYGGNAYSETSAAQAHSGTNYFKVCQASNGVVNYTGVYQDYISGPGTVYSANGWAYILSTDKPAGQNALWLEVTFRDAFANILALYRSVVLTAPSFTNGTFPVNTWINLPVTNQYNPGTFLATNTTSQLTAPAGTYFVRYQVVFQGDAAKSGGSMYFDDLSLIPAGGSPYGSWNITWSDEFNGITVNTNIWANEVGNGGSNPGWGNNELEYYTSQPANMFVTNGCLHIVALHQTTNGYSYTSARMKTQAMFSDLYGRIEWRAQLPPGVGCWPALWMLGTNINPIGWPGCGEVDVMESRGSNTFAVQGSLHSGSDETAVYNIIDGNSLTNFHTYTLDWAAGAILFYVDGHLYESQTGWGSSTSNPFPFPFNQPFFFLMNLAIGGNYVGNPSQSAINSGTPFPATLLVDYIRIYNVTGPLQISIIPAGSNIFLTWPSDIVCHLQAQTNLPGSSGIGTNWIDVPTLTNSLQVTPGNTAAFYRLKSP